MCFITSIFNNRNHSDDHCYESKLLWRPFVVSDPKLNYSKIRQVLELFIISIHRSDGLFSISMDASVPCPIQNHKAAESLELSYECEIILNMDENGPWSGDVVTLRGWRSQVPRLVLVIRRCRR